MKKIFITSILIILSIILYGCTPKTEVIVPDFFGMNYGDVLNWSFDNDIILEVSNEYSDLVKPRQVFYQNVLAGEKVLPNSNIVIVYSRGYDPDGIIEVPDFNGFTKEQILEWLVIQDISRYYFSFTFNASSPEGSYIGVEVSKKEERNDNLRKDTYTFYFSKGLLEVETVDFLNPSTIRGVNLGGWFVLEGWITPDLFEGISGSDETVFMIERNNAQSVIENHWDTFIVEEDFAWLKEHGVSYVRLPIPWWLYGEGIYAESYSYIQRAMSWADKYNIKVLLDLHTAPGSQNGFDNGGLTGVLEWEQPANVLKTIEVLGQIAEDFSIYDSLWGIEVLNEPGWGVDMTILQNFYIEAYQVIRQHNSEVYIGFHDGFRSYENQWINFFNSNNFSNVFFDLHFYQTFGDTWSEYDILDHVQFVHSNQKDTIAKYDGVVPIIIGEWSLGLQGNVYEGLNTESIELVRRAFGNAQLNEYENAFGWFFWNYKINQNSHYEWDFRRLIEGNTLPNQYLN